MGRWWVFTGRLVSPVAFNIYHENYGEIAQVRSREYGDHGVGVNSSVQYPLITELKANYKSYFKHIVAASWDVDNLWIGERAMTNWQNHFRKVYVQLRPEVDFEQALGTLRAQLVNQFFSESFVVQSAGNSPRVGISMKSWRRIRLGL